MGIGKSVAGIAAAAIVATTPAPAAPTTGQLNTAQGIGQTNMKAAATSQPKSGAATTSGKP